MSDSHIWSADDGMALSAIGAPTLGARHEEARQSSNSAGLEDRMVANLKPDSTTPLADVTADALRARVVRITPERAATMLTTLSFERQRAISPKHVEYLLATMRTGELTDMVIQEAEFPNGRKVLVDGYHRLTALVQYGRPLLAVIVTHSVNSEHELAERYAKIDRSFVRKPKDMLRAFGIEDRSEMSVKMLSTVSAGVAIVANDFPRHSGSIGARSLIQRTNNVDAWLPEGRLYAACLNGATNEVSLLLSRAPVTAVALATLRYQPSLAEPFWSRIAADDGLLKDSPEGRLLTWLRANRVTQHGQFFYCRHVAGAWNAYFEGRTLKLLKIADPSAPVSIAGTPYGKA